MGTFRLIPQESYWIPEALLGNYGSSNSKFDPRVIRRMGTLLHLSIHVRNNFLLSWVTELTKYRHGDSWAAKALAGVTLGLFTGVLAWFTFKIWQTARRLKAMEGDASGLYDKKDFWLKYSLFYDSYKKDFWWLFIPTIIYMFAKGCVLAAADGHGLTQTVAQLVIECLSKLK